MSYLCRLLACGGVQGNCQLTAESLRNEANSFLHLWHQPYFPPFIRYKNLIEDIFSDLDITL